MGSVEEGAEQAVKNCMKVKKEEKVVIITDRETLAIGSAIKTEVEKITEDCQLFIMEDFGKRPINFPEEIGSDLMNADASFYVAQDVIGEFQTFRILMFDIIKANKKLRHGHMIGVITEIMSDGMCGDYQNIQRISHLVYEQVKDATQIRVVAPGGTDIIANFSQKLTWIIQDGNIAPDNWMNLPDGEVFTCPININGTIVIDGCIGAYFAEKYGCIETTPLTVIIKNGRAIRESIHCENKDLKEDFVKYVFETDENSNRVGEFAIGTNLDLTELIGNLLQDEKFPGVHIAFGDPFKDDTGADWESKGHIDGVIKNTTIYVDGEMIMKEGKFLFY